MIRKVMLFVLLFGSLGRAYADLEMVVDLVDGQESMISGQDVPVCEQRCLEVHRIGGYAVFILRDDEGHVSHQVLPWLDDREEYGLKLEASSATSAQGSLGRKKPLTGNGGNCGYEKVNCIETFIVPGGYVVIIEYGPDGKIKSYKPLPVLNKKK